MQWKRHYASAGLTAPPNESTKTIMLNGLPHETPRPIILKQTKLRLRALIKQVLVIPAVEAQVDHILDEEFVVSSDVLYEIKKE
jgi:hypothetical protein